jgi:hypothetical protein
MASSSDTFVERARERMASLGRDIAQMEAQEEGVRRRLREMREQMATWERTLALYVEEMNIDVADPVPGQLAAPMDSVDASVPDLVEQYMQAKHAPVARITELTEWLTAIGRFSGDDPKAGQKYGQVYTALLRHPRRFVKEAPGTFRLAVES